jgi:hypothetical protein
MNKRTDYINGLIKANGFSSYLEIGLGDGNNFRGVDVQTKIGIDPAVSGKDIGTLDSDTFFEHCQDTFDLIFIDGLHHADQVERDIVNSWNFLNKGGMILIHDIKPHTFEMQQVPRIQPVWTGDVWRAWNGLKINTKLKLDYWDDEYGLGIIHKSRHKLELGFVDMETTFEDYKANEGWLIKS